MLASLDICSSFPRPHRFFSSINSHALIPVLSTLPLSVGVSPRSFSILDIGRSLVANSPALPSFAAFIVSDTGACANFAYQTAFSAILLHFAAHSNTLNHLLIAISAPTFAAHHATLDTSAACPANFEAHAASFSAPAAFATRLVHFAPMLARFAPPSTTVRRSDAVPTGSFVIASFHHSTVPYLCFSICCHCSVVAKFQSPIAVSVGFVIPLAIPDAVFARLHGIFAIIVIVGESTNASRNVVCFALMYSSKLPNSFFAVGLDSYLL